MIGRGRREPVERDVCRERTTSCRGLCHVRKDGEHLRVIEASVRMES